MWVLLQGNRVWPTEGMYRSNSISLLTERSISGFKNQSRDVTEKWAMNRGS